MKELLEIIAGYLVDEPDKVTVSEETSGDTVILKLSVAQSDMGKVIGKSGRIAKAIRAVMNAAASKDRVKVIVDIQ